MSVSKSIAQAKEVERAGWRLPVEVDLSTARSTPELIGSYPQSGDCVVYLPDSTGIGTIYLDSPTTHGYEMDTDFDKIRAYFQEIYLSNLAQPGSTLYLEVGEGDIDVRGKVQAIREVLGRNQAKWYALWSGAISANSVTTVDIYTGTSGWRLYYGGGMFSCDADVPQRVVCQIQMPGYPFVEVIEYRYKLQGVVNFVNPAIVRIESDENMNFLVYNDDDEEHTFYITMLGMEERVLD